jgi:hypothetical protein
MPNYNIIDNGGIVFVAIVTPSTKTIEVFKNEFIGNGKYKMGKKVLNAITYQKIFIPKKDKGNSLLVKLDGDDYIYVGDTIGRFKLDDLVVGYKSPIGNSGVPYPYIETKDWYYLLLEKVRIPKFNVKGGDPYKTYYAKNEDDMRGVKNFRMKTLVKRQT